MYFHGDRFETDDYNIHIAKNKQRERQKIIKFKTL